MILSKTEFMLKDGRLAVLRSPTEKDAEEMLRFIVKVSGETDFLMRYPEEFEKFTLEQERNFINGDYYNENALMVACSVEDSIAGICQISFRTGMKDGHRASVAIALLQDYWNLGIGTKMFEELFRVAGEREGVRQIELDFIEGNTRARALYEKMGFRITGVKPDAIRRKDGSFVNEYMMVKRLRA